MKKAKPPPEGTYRDPNGCLRVDAGHLALGKYKIEVSQVSTQNKAVSICRGLNSMPTNIDPEMFSVFGTKQTVQTRDEHRGKIDVPGFMVKRKVLLNDKLQFLQYSWGRE